MTVCVPMIAEGLAKCKWGFAYTQVQVGLCLYSSVISRSFLGSLLILRAKWTEKREHHLVDRALGQALAECKWG